MIYLERISKALEGLVTAAVTSHQTETGKKTNKLYTIMITTLAEENLSELSQIKISERSKMNMKR